MPCAKRAKPQKRAAPGCSWQRYIDHGRVSAASTPNSRELSDWLAKDGQLLIPLVELLEKGERAIDEVIDVMGRATIARRSYR